MSRRPIEEKKRRKTAKAFRRTPLPRYFDIVEWLVSRQHAPTKRAAREMILAGRVKSGSHPVGQDTLKTVKVVKGKFDLVEEPIVNPRVPISLRDDLIVSGA